MADPIWERKFRGEHVSITLDDITNHRMRELKAAFGPEYGIPAQFVAMLNIGDADALTGALWIHAQAATDPGEEVKQLRGVDLLDIDWKASEFAAPDKPKTRPGKGSRSQSRPSSSSETSSSETLESSSTGSSS